MNNPDSVIEAQKEQIARYQSRLKGRINFELTKYWIK